MVERGEKMDIKSILLDKRINAWNVLFEMPISEYLDFARSILGTNDLQRKKIRDSNKVYRLLKEDLKQGCIMPPIVLALRLDIEVSKSDVENNGQQLIRDNLSNILIIDGIQRTNIMISIDDMIKEQQDTHNNTDFYNNVIRLEIYIGIRRTGILYRMLTLNTGQTRMSLRHQIEIMYSDYIDQDKLGEIKLIRETSDDLSIGRSKYIFRDVVDGYNSFLTRYEFPLNREDLLEKMDGLEELSKEKFEEDLFVRFVRIYDKFINRIYEYRESLQYDKDELEEYLNYLNPLYNYNVFGIDKDDIDEHEIEGIKNKIFDINKLFNKSIAMTGFGAALGKLIDLKVIDDLTKIDEIIDTYTIQNNECLVNLYYILQNIKGNAKNIGTEHRRYYNILFRELYNINSDSYLDMDKAVLSAKKMYDSYKI